MRFFPAKQKNQLLFSIRRINIAYTNFESKTGNESFYEKWLLNPNRALSFTVPIKFDIFN